jgi:excisionase family DNA binding protein
VTDKALLTTVELAEKLKVSDRTIMRWMKVGLPYMRAGRTTRFDFDDVEQWMKTRKEVNK